MYWYRYLHPAGKTRILGKHIMNCEARYSDQSDDVRYKAACSCGWKAASWDATHGEAEERWLMEHWWHDLY